MSYVNASDIFNAIGPLFKRKKKNPDGTDADETNGAAARARPESIDTLCQRTRFSKPELQVIYRGFKQQCPSGVLSEDTFKQIFNSFFPQGDPSAYAHHIFAIFDTERVGALTFDKFVTGLSLISRGSVEEKLRWLFSLYDLNKDGMITKDELLKITSSIYQMMGTWTKPCVTDATAHEHVERIFMTMDIDRDGKVSQSDFVTYCHNNNEVLRNITALDTVF